MSSHAACLFNENALAGSIKYAACSMQNEACNMRLRQLLMLPLPAKNVIVHRLLAPLSAWPKNTFANDF